MKKQKEDLKDSFNILKKSVESPKRVMDPSYYRSLILKRHFSFGQKAADILTKSAGSWTFIFILSAFIFIWIFLNVTAYTQHWDPWPFIILNLCLSCLAAMQAPVILMSQNREAERDRLRSEYDYAVNRKAEREIREIKQKVDKILKLTPKK